MSLKIRLARRGAKKRPFYAVVVADSRSPRDGRFIEKIGTYDPMLDKAAGKRWTVDLEAAKAWIAKGATPTDRVLRHFADQGLMTRAARNNPAEGRARQEGAGARRREGQEGGKCRKRRSICVRSSPGERAPAGPSSRQARMNFASDNWAGASPRVLAAIEREAAGLRPGLWA